MARAAQEKIYADFSGGYLTEGNLLSYPENAASELSNFDLKENGSIQRRLGMGFEASASKTLEADRPNLIPAVNTFKWNNVNGVSSEELIVIQTGARLDFYSALTDGITDQAVAYPSITLTPVSGNSSDDVYVSDISAASGAGVLFIAGRYITPSYLQVSGSSVVRVPIDMKIRDFEIWKEGEFELDGTSLAGEVRQSTMSAYHQYNMYNQGWPDIRDKRPFTGVGEDTTYIALFDNAGGDVFSGFPLLETFNRHGYYPTTANLFHTYQQGAGNTTLKQRAYDIEQLDPGYDGNTKTARGHSILTAFSRRREGKGSNNINIWETTSTKFRPEAVAFYAGRVWYAGTQGKGFSSEVYFSQVIGNDLSNAGLCMQDADPTAEVVNELVATDGGVLSIDEMGKVYAMRQFSSSLVLITSEGAWAISGAGDNASFTADSFSVKKITDKAAVSAASIVEAKDSIFYLGTTAIYIMSENEVGYLAVKDVSSDKVKTFYQSLSTAQKSFVFSVYDAGQDRVFWYYPSTVDISSEPVPIIDEALYLDISLGAYGRYTLSATSAAIPRSAVGLDINTVLVQVDTVVAGASGTVVANGVEVCQTIERIIPDRSSVKFLVIEDNGVGNKTYRFADYRDTKFKDFDTAFVSTVNTGFDSLGDIMRKTKKAPVCIFHLERTEDGFELNPDDIDGLELQLKNQSSCLVSYKWDWGDKPFSNQFQAYRLLKNYTPSGTGDAFNYDRAVATSKNRLRGRGTSIGFSITSEEEKDLRLLGYGVLFTVGDMI
jgi:hypothetical protein